MKTGMGLVLIGIGAILAFAVTTNTSVFNLHTAGYVIMIIGVLGLAGTARSSPSPAPKGGAEEKDAPALLAQFPTHDSRVPVAPSPGRWRSSNARLHAPRPSAPLVWPQGHRERLRLRGV